MHMKVVLDNSDLNSKPFEVITEFSKQILNLNSPKGTIENTGEQEREFNLSSWDLKTLVTTVLQLVTVDVSEGHFIFIHTWKVESDYSFKRERTWSFQKYCTRENANEFLMEFVTS